MTDLKPCPFCGYDDAFVERITLGSCAVICNQCQARGPASCPEDDEDLRLEEENDWEPGEAAARRLWNRRTPPEGMALVPREITAESGHKAGMMSEFSQSIPVMCEACAGDGEDEHDDSGVCSECDGAGEYERNVNISWTTIKAIHKRIVEIVEGDES